MKMFSCFALVLLSLPAFSQDELQIIEQRRKAEMMRVLDSGIYYMDIERYDLADAKFKFVLQNIKAVPSDLTYYFGKNSFLLGNYKQSIDWLNKYIQLKGTSGQFYDDALSVLKKAEIEFNKSKSQDVKKAEEVLSKNYDIDCGPGGKAYCPVCKGDHVIVKKGPFGDEFKTCPYCDDHGLLSCEDYNKLLRGELKKKTN
jgi:tetratricopeptide (TPR) repeat protein